MASLDKVEGDLVEGVGLIILGIIAYVAYLAYKGFSLPSLSSILGNIQAFLNDLFNTTINRVTPGPFQTGTNPKGSDIQVFTGTNQGQWITPQSDTIDYQIPEQQLQELSMTGQYIDPFAGLPPVQLPTVG